MKTKDIIRISAAAVLFVLSAAVYFSPLAIPHKIAAGLLMLTLFSAGNMPWTMTAAFFFSFLGDLAGSFKSGSASDIPFLLQMAGFAAAHVFFIIYFLRLRGLGISLGRSSAINFGYDSGMSVERGLDMSSDRSSGMSKVHGPDNLPGSNSGASLGSITPWRCSAYALFAAIVLLCAIIIIVPCVPPGILRIGVLLYAVIIASMLMSALLTGDALISAGAVLFVFSDFILATDIFVTHIPYSGYLVMIPYYAAQLVFFLRSTVLSLRS